MRKKYKIILKTFLLCIAILTLQNNSFGQNIIVVHKKNDGRNYDVQVGKRVRVITFDNRNIKGKISQIRDSTLIIRDTASTTEIAIKNIKILYFCKLPGWNIASGELIAGTGLIIYASNQKNNTNIILTGMFFAWASYMIIHKNRFSAHKYDFMIINPKSKLYIEK